MYGLAKKIAHAAFAAAIALGCSSAGCGNTGSKVESLKGWTVPEGKEIVKMKLKQDWMKPVADVVECKDGAVEPLLKCLASSTPADSCGFMTALAFLHAAKAVDPIIEILRKEEGPPGEYAAFALSKLDKEGSLKKLADLEGGASALPPAARKNYYRAFAWARNTSFCAALAKGTADPDQSVRDEVLGMLGTIKHPSLAGPLLDALKAGPSESAALAAKALAFNREHVNEREVLALVSSDKEFVREGVIELLGLLDTPAGYKAILAALNDSSPRVGKAAAAALGIVKHKKPAKEEIIKIAAMLDSPDEDTARTAHDTLIKLGAAEARETILAILDSTKIHAKRFASSLLVQCAPKKEVSEKTDLTGFAEIPKLIELLASPDRDTVLNSGNTLMIYTGRTFDDEKKLWDQWWENHKALMKFVGEAQKLIAAVKKWKQEETLGEHKEEAIANLEKAGELYEQAEEAGLTKMSFDNEHTEINLLLRQVRSTGGMD